MPERRFDQRQGRTPGPVASRLLAFILLLFTGILAACGEVASDRFMSIGTGGTGGLYYVLGGAIASQLTTADPARQYTAEVTGGSVENVNRIREGQLDLGIAMAITAVDAYTGEGAYGTPVSSLRIVAPFYANVAHVLVARNSQARSIADLRGQRVSVGSAGSGTEQEARHILEAAGIGYQDIRPFFLSFSESASGLQDGSIDAAIISAGYPAGAVLEATTTGGARLIPLGDDVLATLRSRYPFYDRGEIASGVYRGVTEAIPTVQANNWIVAREDLPDDVAVALLEIIVDRADALAQVHEMAKQIDVAALRDAPIPLHPAAERWLAARTGE